MKKWKVVLLTVASVLSLLAGCSEQQLATTLMSGQDTDLKVLVGSRTGDVEVGGVIQYTKKDDIEWGPEPTEVGVYVRYYLTQDVTVEDTPQPSVFAPWLEQFHARPYVGLDLMGSTDRSVRHVQPNWVIGTAFSLEDDVDDVSRAFINVDYVDGDQAKGDTFVSLTYLF